MTGAVSYGIPRKRFEGTPLMTPRASVRAVVLVLAALGAGGCASPQLLPAAGNVAGYAVRGQVDSVLARDYLEGRPLPVDLAHARQRYLAAGEVPSREALQAISRRYSADLATLLFLETMGSQPRARELRERYATELAYVRSVGVDRARPDVPEDLLILLVPGWFYVTHGSETNADYGIQRRLLTRWRIPHRVVAIHENGTVEDNARIVADAVRRVPTGRRAFLVSASKSGAEVALALGRELTPREAEPVAGWLSIVGVVQGSPLADRVLQSNLCLVAKVKLGSEGFDLEGARSMQTTRARRAFEALRFPRHVRTFSLIAVPLSGDISDRASFGYARMRELGPNDGLTLLADEVVPQAAPLLFPGMDHYLGTEEPDVWSTTLFRLIAREVAGLHASSVSQGESQ
jgi:hypothetical protein